jgi:hypothetical protein
MQTENRLFEDVARVASGAISTLGGLKDEVEARIKERVERLAGELDLVTREELEAMQAVAIRAREEQERLAAHVATLEARLAALERGAAAPAGDPPAAPA